MRWQSTYSCTTYTALTGLYAARCARIEHTRIYLHRNRVVFEVVGHMNAVVDIYSEIGVNYSVSVDGNELMSTLCYSMLMLGLK
jgi:hypothetical protein